MVATVTPGAITSNRPSAEGRPKRMVDKAAIGATFFSFRRSDGRLVYGTDAWRYHQSTAETDEALHQFTVALSSLSFVRRVQTVVQVHWTRVIIHLDGRTQPDDVQAEFGRLLSIICGVPEHGVRWALHL